MNKFLVQSLGFLILVVILAFVAPLLPDMNQNSSMVFALTDKHKILEKLESPKVILLGGSNISFGTNTKRLMDSLEKNTFDLGVHAGLGLKFMMDDAKRFVKKGDVVVLIPEYGQFMEDAYYGNDEVIQVLFDAAPEAKKDLNFKQISYLLNKMPSYIGNKYYNYFTSLLTKKATEDTVIRVYHRKAFDKYGDHTAHLGLPRESFSPDALYFDQPAVVTIEGIRAFADFVKSQGAEIVISYPSYQQSSFKNSAHFISKIDKELREKTGAKVISLPERYAFNDSLFYNTYYHLDAQGRELRTDYLLEDLKKAIKK
jgi:hypothetical protein